MYWYSESMKGYAHGRCFFILWGGRAENEAVGFKTGRSCSVRNGGFRWEEFVINADAEVSQM